jgi:hypothetical protein
MERAHRHCINTVLQRIEEEDEDELVAADGAMEGEEGAGPLQIVVHLDPKFFVIGLEIARRDAIADFARKTGLGEAFAHLINESPVR